MLTSLSPARRRLVLAVVAGVLVAATAIVLVVVGNLRGHPSANARPAAVTAPGPVLLVPGYGGSTASLEVLAGRLRAHGRDAQVVHLPDNAQGDLRTQARSLATAADAALSRTSATAVDIVGYSAGGVVARLWAKDFGGAAKARRIITLGAPQHGTALASLGALVPGECPVACTQLVPGSNLLAALNSGNEVPSGPSFVSIWTLDDQVVLPPESARLAGGLNLPVQDVCAASGVQHSDLPTDSLVTAIVVLELQAGPPAQLTSADCARLSS